MAKRKRDFIREYRGYVIRLIPKSLRFQIVGTTEEADSVAEAENIIDSIEQHKIAEARKKFAPVEVLSEGGTPHILKGLRANRKPIIEPPLSGGNLYIWTPAVKQRLESLAGHIADVERLKKELEPVIIHFPDGDIADYGEHVSLLISELKNATRRASRAFGDNGINPAPKSHRHKTMPTKEEVPTAS